MSTKAFYDQRYSGDYRERPLGYEVARREALEHFATRVVDLGLARQVLDYGAGSGLHVDVWERIFPHAELHFCDLSTVARDKFRARYPRHADRYWLVCDDRAACADGLFDVVVSVEVMEHVEQLSAYLRDVRRLLKPNGWFVWTTPCANALSIEHVYSALTGNIEAAEGRYRRWSWEDPGHLRRLKSRELAGLLRDEGFSDSRFRFRAHFFSFLCSRLPVPGLRAVKERLMTLDYRLLRRLPNGASMIGAARKA